MLRYLISSDGSIADYVIQLLLCLPIFFLSLSLHETAHGFMAYKLGDPTAKNFGRLTLNPLNHLDPFGFLCMLLVGFGWAKPVPINTRHFKKPRRDIALTSLAGPVSNLLLGFIFVVILRFTATPILENMFFAEMSGNVTMSKILWYLYVFIYLAIQLNVRFAVFNLLPIPPLDGSKILFMFLPPKAYSQIAPYERYISLGFTLLLLLGVITPVLSKITEYIMDGMFFVVGL